MTFTSDDEARVAALEARVSALETRLLEAEAQAGQVAADWHTHSMTAEHYAPTRTGPAEAGTAPEAVDQAASAE